MPLYFVNLHDGLTTTLDDAGAHAPTPEVARDKAVRLVTEVSRAVVGGSSEQLLVASIRDGADQSIYQIMPSLICRRLG